MERDDLTPPARRSMSDDELEQLIQQAHADSSGTLQAMEVVAQQAQLRQQDDLVFAQWVTKLESIGTPEAIAAINQAKIELGIAPTTSKPETESAPPAAPVEPVAEEFEYRPVSTLGVAKVEIPAAEVAEPEPLEHDLAPVAGNFEAEEVVDVALDLHTGVAVSDFNAILHSHVEDEQIDYEPEEIETGSINQVTAPRRTGVHPVTQFWTWLALGAGVLPIYLGLTLKTVGLTGLQAFIALLTGVLASAVVIAVGAVAGKRSGMPTVFLARSTFGVFGNALPATFVLVARMAFTAVLALIALQLLDGRLFKLDFSQSLASGASLRWATVGGLALFLILTAAVVVAAVSSRVLVWVQISVGALGLIASVYVASQTTTGLGTLLVNTNGSWWATMGAALLIFAGYGGFWSHASADFTRSLPASASGFKVFGFAALGAIVPVIGGSVGILWAQTEQVPATGSALALAISASLVLGLVVSLSMSIASTSFTLQALGIKGSFAWLLPIVALVTLGLALWGQASGFKFEQIIVGYLPMVGVPLLAWTGLFVSEVLIRRIAYHEVSLQRAYGIYRGVNWVSVSGFVVATGLGCGYVSSSASGASWLGFLIKLSGSSAFWLEAQIGLGMAFLVAALVPVVFGISRIKRQEAEVLAIENRRFELDDVAIDS